MALRTARTHELGGHEPRAVQKALALLEAVARLGSGATAKEIAHATSTPPATAYRLLNILVADGFLVRIDDLSGFALGRRTRELAGAAPSTEVDYSQVIDTVRGRTRFGVYLATYAGDRIRLLDRDPDHELTGETALTTHVHASAIGKLLLANRADGNSLADLRKFTSHTIVDLADLAIELSRIRATDVATERDEIKMGRSAVAVPVRDDTGGVSGCIAVIGRTGRLDPEDPELLDLLRSSASQITLCG
ncbi:IclR family transcriptional regulator [Rhodococcus sp. RS1C4]|uniref:IclR family transcriptional regulator n=1 Tax=Nocardiaceae TaxID=85025 RepID=UPI000366F66C|nr:MULTISPECIES: IclR family transcriptional regulator C-terminal domain-containing protein [Rhodococcus]OZC55735.1 IclR family transcriptional regulator [Rhodococcus sp. 06-621-2]OZC58871.1 IclR family transcriptional regulator [Rhodococcus sp. RS1C4]OZD07611.1 IclR family transcriptional regulator [Rhodococcus sp. 06-156-4C]OZD17179.1 IclR family transcriptional regulator [Rhodococcus sp. 06-156-3C]OZD18517.1 IclR family transcriptional regulator [Rhodococcus sp. 06-156-4a]